MAYLFDTGIFSAVTSASAVMSGAKLYFYDAGTTTLKDTYTSSALDPLAKNANPVVADANGRWPAIWMEETLYKVKFTSSDETVILTRDNVGREITGGDIGFLQSATYAADTVGAKLKYLAIDRRDYASLQAAVNAAASSGRALYLGDEEFTQATTVTLPDNDLCIFGPGSGALTITFTGTGGLFVGSALSAAANIDIGGFKALAGAANCGRPVSIEYASSSGINTRAVRVHDVIASSDEADPTKYWTGGPYVKHARNSILSDCYTLGPTADLTRTVDGYKIAGEATDVKLSNCQAVSVGTALDIIDNVEGTILSNFVAVDVNIGVSKVHSGGGEPWLAMNGNWHINCRSIGIRMAGVLQATIGMGLLYAQNATAPWVGIKIASGSGTNQDFSIDAMIDGQLAGIAASNLTGLSVESGNGVKADLKLRTLGTGIDIASGVTNCLIGIDPASDVTTICTGTGLNTSSNRIIINDPSNSYLLPSPVSAANLDASATANKDSALGAFGRDTSGTLKPAAQLVASSADANWVNSILLLNVRRSDALAIGFYLFGTGTPEGAVTAPVGALYTRSDGGASTTLYVKTSGTGNTGWTAK